METSRIKIGIAGVGKMGGYHLQKFLAAPDAEVVGIYDADSARAEDVAQRNGVRAFASLTELLFETDAMVVATTTAAHYPVSRAALEAGVHVLVEKPIAETPEEARALARLAEERGLILQVGLIERYRCHAITEGVPLSPIRFIESHRLSPSRPREGNIDVVSDLMIHDLDLALSLVGEEPIHVSAIGVAVLTNQTDMANVRLEFPSGAVVNLSASRVSTNAMRKFRFFAGEAYASLDFMKNSMDYYRRTPDGIEHRTVEKSGLDALREQAASFLRCVRTGERPLVSGHDGALALEYAQLVRQRIEERGELWQGGGLELPDGEEKPWP